MALEDYQPDSSGDLLQRLLQLLGNFSQVPRPTGGEDAYGAALKRQYDRNFMMEIQRNAAINNATTQFFGVNPNNPLVQGAGLLFGDPYGGYGQAMKMLTGSNPMLAASQMYSGGQGAAMGAFGRFGHVGTQEVAQAQTDFLTSAFYNHRNVTDAWKTDYRNNIINTAQTYANNNPAIAALYGVDKNNQFNPFVMKPGQGELGISNSDLNNLQGTIREMQGTSDKDAQKKIADDFLKKVPKIQAVVADYLTKNKGDLDASALQNIAQSITSNPLSTALLQLKNMPDKSIFGGVNYGISRGYSQEEIVGGFNRAAQLQLLGRHGYRESFVTQDGKGGFAVNAPQAMSAFRPIAGALGTDEVSAINQLLGTDSVDLTTSAGSEKVAKLGRDVAAVTRVAGISIKSLVGMVKTMQDLVAQNPELSYMGSGTTQLVLDATKKATALNAILSPEESRRQGGVQGITNRELSVNANGLTSNISKLVGGSLYLARGLGTDKEAQMQKLIDQFEKGSQTPADINNFIRSSAGLLNINPYNAGDILTSSDVTTGMASDPVSRATALKAFRSNLTKAVDQMLAGTNISFKQLSDVFNKGGLYGKTVTDANGKTHFEQGLEGYAATFKGGAAEMAIRSLLDPNNPNHQTFISALDDNTKDAQAAFAKVDKFTAQTARDAEIFDQSNAGNYATSLQNIVNTVASGKIGTASDLFNTLRNSLISPSSSEPDKNKFKAFGNFINAAQNKGGTNATDTVALMNGYGFSGKEVNEAAFTRLRDLLGSGKSQAQIMEEIKKDGELSALVKDNPNLISQSVIDSVGNSHDNFNGLLGAFSDDLTQAQRDAAKKSLLSQDQTDLLDDIKGIGGNNTAAKYLRAKLKSDSAGTLASIGSDGLSKFLSGSGASAADIAAVTSSTPDDISDLIGAHEKGQLTGKDDSTSDAASDPISKIFELLKNFMGSGNGSMTSNLQALTNAINTLRS